MTFFLSLFRSKIILTGSSIFLVVIYSLIIMITPPILSLQTENSENALKSIYLPMSAITPTYFILPPASASSDFNFAAVGDWGCTPDTEKTIKNINSSSPEIILALGDLSYNDNSAKCWLDIIDPMADKTFIAFGNHESDSSQKLKDYMNYFKLDKQYYSFDYNNVHFMVMSTELPYEESSKQYIFVNNDLSNASLDPDIKWIVVLHHNMQYTSETNSGKGNRADKELRSLYHPLFSQYDVDLVLQAHNHNYQRSYPIEFNNDKPKKPIITNKENNNNYYQKPTGIVFATVGTGGVSIYDFKSQAQFISNQYAGFGYLNIEIKDNGNTLYGTFYANDGTIKDEFTINK
ncbi:MAG: metallophosphoesterase [Nitrososphaeraceae archaeon]